MRTPLCAATRRPAAAALRAPRGADAAARGATQKAAQESVGALEEALKGADMVFVTVRAPFAAPSTRMQRPGRLRRAQQRAAPLPQPRIRRNSRR